MDGSDKERRAGRKSEEEEEEGDDVEQHIQDSTACASGKQNVFT